MKPTDFSSVRLIAMDLDGTLLNKEKTISPRTLQALEECRRRGIKLAFVTGRSRKAARQYEEMLRPEGAVFSYGAQIMLQGETIARRHMSPQVAGRVLAGAKAAAKIRYQLKDGPYFSSVPMEGCLPMEEDAPLLQPVEHIALWDFPENAARTLAKKCGCALTQAVGDRWCNFSARGTGKGPGMGRLMNALGLEKGQALAFGDESCDVEFFRICGIGVAMENGDAFTRAHADYQTENNDCDGIAIFLEKYLLSMPSNML
ncbi:MAG: HAD family phosphatase [Clostridia bacterium]|nr:HAD family phosphatase [Clostridia bacterium]